jgi:hypothetical protein
LTLYAIVLQINKGGSNFEVFHRQYSTNFERNTKLDLSTEPALLGRFRWLLCYFVLSSLKCQFSCLRFGYNYPLFQNPLDCLKAPLIYHEIQE